MSHRPLLCPTLIASFYTASLLPFCLIFSRLSRMICLYATFPTFLPTPFFPPLVSIFFDFFLFLFFSFWSYFLVLCLLPVSYCRSCVEHASC
ncbi:hypothetical protein BJ912DRAFT_950649 [Pholiota molesta]|nr:hypothetical protein BJ912DRAFT_950649 [Pholiota molesta]